jgi:diguanylate cyclase (GGDEF)-like protein
MARRVPLALEWLVRLRPAHAWLLIVLCVDLAALGDVVSGPHVWLGPVYLVVICLAAWCLGWRAGHLTGLSCMALTFAINGVTLYPYGSFDLAWNFAMRFAAVSMIIAVVAGSRRAYIREWWLARTDPLTCALNRQAFFELGTELAELHSWRLLIYADLDGLKQINDRQGHAAGDSSLKSYAEAVRKAIRRDDMFARVGGDEFLIFMQVSDQSAASAVAARLHREMNSVFDDAGVSLRCSVGGLIVPPGQMHMDQLVRAADHLMYQAKLLGGSLQVEVAQVALQGAPSGRARKAPRGRPIKSGSTRKPLVERRINVAVRPFSGESPPSEPAAAPLPGA